MANTYEQMLELAKKTKILTEEELGRYGASYYSEEMGLWVGQDADGGGIIPYGWQMANSETAGDTKTMHRLFVDLGRQADIDAYEEWLLATEKERKELGYRDDS